VAFNALSPQQRHVRRLHRVKRPPSNHSISISINSTTATMEQTRAINALEPWLHLAKSANHPRRAAELISQAISSPSTYVFAELLQKPHIQALRDSPEYSPHLRLLEIFAWGTMADYQSKPAVRLRPNPSLTPASPDSPTPLPPLSPAARAKLQLLSLLSAAAAAPTGSPIPYATLQPALAADPDAHRTPAAAARALEAAAADAVLAGLLDARLDPRARAVHLVGGVPALRDVPPGALPRVARGLEAWVGRCDGALAEAARREHEVRAAARERALRDGRVRERFRARVESVAAAAAATAGGAGGGGGGGGGADGPSGGLSPSDGGDGKKRALGVEGKEVKKMAKREPAAASDLMELDSQGKGAKRPHFGFGKRAG
jgi:COP9 signalosome complex subunit 7